MKKIYSWVLLIGSLLLFIIGDATNWNFNEASVFQEQPAKVFAEEQQSKPFIIERQFERVLTLKARQPIYMKQDNLVRIGELQAGQAVALTRESQEYYEIRIGKMPAFIRKGQAVVRKKNIPTPAYNERLGAIKTSQQTPVYAKADKRSDVLLTLEKDYRYPILGQQDEWYVIKVGERAGYIQKSSVTHDEGLPVLLYHQVLPRESMKTEMSTVSLENFERQMSYLADREYTTLTSQQLYDYLEGSLVVPNKAVLITFDDGLLSSKEYAYPILKQHGFTAPHHIISSRLENVTRKSTFDGGSLEYVTMDDMDDMKDVFEYEAHTCALHEINNESGKGYVFDHTQQELTEDLRQNLQQVPAAVSLAYPYGQYNEEFIAAAKEVGLLIGFTTVDGYANTEKSNYEVNRFGITEKRSFEDFTAYVDGDMRWP